MTGYSTKIRKQIERDALAARRQWALENSAAKYVLVSPLEQERDGVAVDGRGRRLYEVMLYAPMLPDGGCRLLVHLGDDDYIEKTYRTQAKARLAFDNIRDFIRRKTLFARGLKYT